MRQNLLTTPLREGGFIPHSTGAHGEPVPQRTLLATFSASTGVVWRDLLYIDYGAYCCGAQSHYTIARVTIATAVTKWHENRERSETCSAQSVTARLCACLPSHRIDYPAATAADLASQKQPLLADLALPKRRHLEIRRDTSYT